MKTKADLLSIIPEIAEIMVTYIPEEVSYNYETGRGRVNFDNELIYDEDGWNISLNYEATVEYENYPDSSDEPGDEDEKIINVVLLAAPVILHEDEETTEFSESDVEEFISALNKEVSEWV